MKLKTFIDLIALSQKSK